MATASGNNPTGSVAANGTTTASEYDLVTLTNVDTGLGFMVINLTNTAPLYVTFASGAVLANPPTVAGTNCCCIPASVASRVYTVSPGEVVVGITSSVAQAYQVEVV